MADKKITQLTNITGANLVDADEFVVVDISADETKAITLGELKEAFDSGSGFVRITGDSMTGNLNFGDNDKAIFGAGSDLQIYSDGTTGQITGDVNITGTLTSDGLTVDGTSSCAAVFNSTTSAYNGSLVDFRVADALVGSIGVSGTELVTGAGDANLLFMPGDNAIAPASTSSGGASNGALDLGRSGRRFKDLHLSGTIEIENGTGNVAVGKQALNSNTASNSTAVGYQAGYSNSTGTENVFLGYKAGVGPTIGSYQTIIGGFSGQVITTGTNNTLVGNHAGDDLTTGSYNCFVGARTSGSTYSGGKITTGSKNTILGSYNGNQGGLDIRTSDNNIVLSDGDGNARVHVNSNGQVDTRERALVSKHSTTNLAQSTWTTVYTFPSGANGTGTFVISTHYAASNTNAFTACAIYMLENSATANFRTVVQSDGSATFIRMNPSNMKELQIKQDYFSGGATYHWSIAQLHYQ